jgi:transposase
VRASFVPPKPIRTLRNLTRYRKTQISDRQREANRLHKILEDTGIKLDCVAADILGVSGRAMLEGVSEEPCKRGRKDWSCICLRVPTAMC